MPDRNQAAPDSSEVRRPEPAAAAADADRAGAAPTPRSERSRRRLLRTVFTLGVVAGTTGALTPVLRAGSGKTGGVDGKSGAEAGSEAAGGGGAGVEAAIDEMYRGRHIQYRRGGLLGNPARASSSASSSSGSALDILIDGRPLHVMRRADGSYLSVVNHYESFPTLLEAARAAVDDLGGARLSLLGPIHHI
ncbi:tyrosinase family oxidase copper chaperone [Streptomyces sp. AK02-01A]|uniref:tyrosinase family oxidase copper chaperone n=1 Tax=Streptomyces sp. AK02-01A TaxID=3028648 RepID=UPI0029A564CF|nr:tyrosinase family oxidase copper chaperone [Streptomyces sp. AK02-01A]MDX3850005.1 tyrosinase family oxidase copper chaperone [Streptomyces sp. AK02-01A]